MKNIAKTDFYSIEVDTTKNRMYLTIVGFWKNAALVPNYLDDIKKAFQELSSGFTILTDVSQMKIPSIEVGPLHERAQVLLNNAGLKKTAEIIPQEKAIEKMALERWAKRSKMPKMTFYDKAKAEAWLDEKV